MLLVRILVIAALWSGAAWLGFDGSKQEPVDVFAIDQDLRVNVTWQNANKIQPWSPMKMAGLRRNYEMSLEMRLEDGAEADIVLARVQSTSVRNGKSRDDGGAASEMVHCRERFVVLRLSTVRSGKALLTRSEALFPGGDLPADIAPHSGFHGGHLVAPLEPVTVQVEHRGRVLKVWVAGKRLPDLVVPDEMGSYALLSRGGLVELRRHIVRPVFGEDPLPLELVALLLSGIAGALAGGLGRMTGQLLGALTLVVVPILLHTALAGDVLPLTRLDPLGNLAAVLGTIPLALGGAATARLKGPMKLVPVLLGAAAAIGGLRAAVELQRPRLDWQPEDPRLELYFGPANHNTSELLEALAREVRTSNSRGQVLRLPVIGDPRQPEEASRVVFLGGGDVWTSDPYNPRNQLHVRVQGRVQGLGQKMLAIPFGMQGVITLQQSWLYRGFYRDYQPAAVVLALRPYDLEPDDLGEASTRIDAWRQVVGEDGVWPADQKPLWGAASAPEVPSGAPLPADQLAKELVSLARDVQGDGGHLVVVAGPECGEAVRKVGEQAARLAPELLSVLVPASTEELVESVAQEVAKAVRKAVAARKARAKAEAEASPASGSGKPPRGSGGR